jgi:hypothetical protein
MWIRAFEILLELKSIALSFKKGGSIPEGSAAQFKESPMTIASGIEKEL